MLLRVKKCRGVAQPRPAHVSRLAAGNGNIPGDYFNVNRSRQACWEFYFPGVVGGESGDGRRRRCLSLSERPLSMVSSSLMSNIYQ